MVIASSTIEVIGFVAILIVLGILAGGFFRTTGRTAERNMQFGNRAPQPPEMRKPPEEGGRR